MKRGDRIVSIPVNKSAAPNTLTPPNFVATKPPTGAKSCPQENELKIIPISIDDHLN